VKKRRNSHFVYLAFDDFSLRYRSFICAVIDRQDNWCSVEFIFKTAKRRADEMNVVLP